MGDKPAGRKRRTPSSRLLSVVRQGGSGAQSTPHVGEHLRHLRQQVELTQEQAAARAGLTRNTIADLERREFPNPHLDVLLALMDVYEVGSIEELLGATPSRVVGRAWRDRDWIGSRRATDDGRR